MYKLIVLLFNIIITVSLNGQYCTNSVGPTTIIDSNVESVNLIGDISSISYIGCPGQLGLEDLTNLTASLTAGNNYTAEIQFGTCGGNYSGNGEAWIDFNHDQIFDPSESIGTWSDTPPSAMSLFNFTVPSGSINGTTRMRVMHREGGTLPLDPCGQYQWGSVMDFSIEITGGTDCSGYLGNTMEEAVIVNAIPYSATNNNSICYTSNNYAYPSPDVYYLILPSTSSHTINVSLCGSSFDTFLSVFDKFGNTINYNDDGDCGSQSNLTFEVEQRDSIYVVVEGWGNESGDYQIDITGEFLNEIPVEQAPIRVFPNPSTNLIYIEGIANQTIYLYNIIGKIVYSQPYKNNESINISHLSSGIYFIKGIHNNQPITRKIIIE